MNLFPVLISIDNGVGSVSPDRLDLSAEEGTQRIFFNIVTPGYRFPESAPYGIDINNAGTEFELHRPNDQHVWADDLNDDHEQHYYSVTVESTTGGDPVVIDPIIIDR